MEYEDLFSPGDIDGSGELCTPAEGLDWIGKCVAALAPDAVGPLEQPVMEFSESLRREHETWIANRPQTH